MPAALHCKACFPAGESHLCLYFKLLSAFQIFFELDWEQQPNKNFTEAGFRGDTDFVLLQLFSF